MTFIYLNLNDKIGIVEKKINIIKFFDEFKERINWSKLFKNKILYDYLCKKNIFIFNKKKKTKFIEYDDYVCEEVTYYKTDYISINYDFDEDYIPEMSIWSKIPLWFLKKYKDYVDWSFISEHYNFNEKYDDDVINEIHQYID